MSTHKYFQLLHIKLHYNWETDAPLWDAIKYLYIGYKLYLKNFIE
jgi:hypothetical protein